MKNISPKENFSNQANIYPRDVSNNQAVLDYNLRNNSVSSFTNIQTANHLPQQTKNYVSNSNPLPNFANMFNKHKDKNNNHLQSKHPSNFFGKHQTNLPETVPMKIGYQNFNQTQSCISANGLSVESSSVRTSFEDSNWFKHYNSNERKRPYQTKFFPKPPESNSQNFIQMQPVKPPLPRINPSETNMHVESNNLLKLLGNLNNITQNEQSLNFANSNVEKTFGLESTEENSNLMGISNLMESLAILKALSNPETLSMTLNMLTGVKNPENQVKKVSNSVIVVDDESPTQALENNKISKNFIQNETNKGGIATLFKNKKDDSKIDSNQGISFVNKFFSSETLAKPLNHIPSLAEKGLNKSVSIKNLKNSSHSDTNMDSKSILIEESSEEEDKNKEPTKTTANTTFLGSSNSCTSPEISKMLSQKLEMAKNKSFEEVQEVLKSEKQIEILLNTVPTMHEEKDKPAPPKKKLLDFFEDSLGLGKSNRELEKHQRCYNLLGQDRTLKTQEKNLLEKLDNFFGEKNDENINKDNRNEQEEKNQENIEKEDDEFNFESRYFKYNPTQVCHRCKKSGHLEKWCSEEAILKCNFCVGSHKMNKCEQIVCFSCLKTGHRIKDCQSPSRETCFRCGKKGHKNYSCGVLNIKESRLAVKEKEENLNDIKCIQCSKEGHVNCGFKKINTLNSYIDDLYKEVHQVLREKLDEEKENEKLNDETNK